MTQPGEKTLDQWVTLALARGVRCSSCQRPARKEQIELYDHDGGYLVSGFASRQWLYFTCSTCGHQNSFTHLGIPRDL